MDELKAILVCWALLFAGAFIAVALTLANIKKLGMKGGLFLCMGAACIAIFCGIELKAWGMRYQCMNNAKGLALTCELYAHDHDGNYPQKLDDLVPNYIHGGPIVFSCPFAPDKSVWGYDYFGTNGKDTDPPDKILIHAHYAIHGKRAVVHCDMSGTWMRVTSS